MERDGYLNEDKPMHYDYFGKPIYLYDEYFEIDDDKYLSGELSQDAIEILINLGATKKSLCYQHRQLKNTIHVHYSTNWRKLKWTTLSKRSTLYLNFKKN